MPKLLGSVLIANRGEIALRIIQACEELGIRSVLAYSEADKDSLPVKLADQAICIGPAQSRLSYQNAQAVLGAALSQGVDAIHPGYGFLAENADFVRLCEEQGVTFVGPPADLIAQMGDKIEARKIAEAAGVPTIPGSDGEISDPEEALKIAREVGFPLLIKASAGGGGRGMRVVESEDTLAKDLREVMAEAEVVFGNPAVYIERYLTDIRHIEVQVLSDSEKTLHLGERDCTAQRRNQKLIEEGPSPVMDEQLREEICQAAVRLCAAVGYRNAGTVEFVFDNVEQKFYFIEMNTRIQVEHPVTELITGVDLIKAQLLIAGGNVLDLQQADIVIHGHAIECRINAEDPERNFMPTPGMITHYRPAGGFGVRMDSHMETGYVVPPFYDSMVGKLITWGQTRDEAISRMIRALDETVIDGVSTTASFHRALLDHPRFRSGEFNTGFVPAYFKEKEEQ